MCKRRAQRVDRHEGAEARMMLLVVCDDLQMYRVGMKPMRVDACACVLCLWWVAARGGHTFSCFKIHTNLVY